MLATVRDRHHAEDLVAEAFTRAWVSWGKLSRHPAPRAWVVRTALNAHASWWRRRRHEVMVSDPEDAAAEAGDGRTEDLMSAVLRLPLRQRQVVALRLFLDLDTVAPGTTRYFVIHPDAIPADSTLQLDVFPPITPAHHATGPRISNRQSASGFGKQNVPSVAMFLIYTGSHC